MRFFGRARENGRIEKKRIIKKRLSPKRTPPSQYRPRFKAHRKLQLSERTIICPLLRSYRRCVRIRPYRSAREGVQAASGAKIRQKSFDFTQKLCYLYISWMTSFGRIGWIDNRNAEHRFTVIDISPSVFSKEDCSGFAAFCYGVRVMNSPHE